MANKEFNSRIRWKKDTSANWTTNNPVLLDGEIAIVITNANETRFKVGDGASAYTELPFQDEPLRTLIAEKLDAPTGGSVGQILEKTETSTQWVDMPESKPTATLITLSSSRWSSNSQTVTVSGVLADESAQMIQPMPTIASQSAYIEAGVLCTNQAANRLTFTCQTVPTSNLTVYVVIQPLS